MSKDIRNIDVDSLTPSERKDLYELARQASLIDMEVLDGSGIWDSVTAKQLLIARYRCCEREIFGGMFLNSSHQVIGFEEIGLGTIDQANIYPREVIKSALRHNAAVVIFFHNHPSWNSLPSEADVAITLKLRNALEIVGVRVLDHFVVGGSSCSSFVEMNLL